MSCHDYRCRHFTLLAAMPIEGHDCRACFRRAATPCARDARYAIDALL